MVHRICSDLIRKQKSFTPVILAFVAICILFAGCRTLLQPGAKDVAGVNHSIADYPVILDISITVIDGNVQMQYDTSVLALGNTAQWDGSAVVSYMGAQFKQDCVSVCDAAGSYKQWRGKWASSDNVSPMLALESWMQKVAAGKGYFQKKPLRPAEKHEAFRNLTKEAFCVTLFDVPMDWSQLCDADPDLLFGGEQLLGEFKTGEIELFFDTENLQLLGVCFRCEEPHRSLVGAITISPSQEQPILPAVAAVDGILNEEWELISQ